LAAFCLRTLSVRVMAEGGEPFLVPCVVEKVVLVVIGLLTGDPKSLFLELGCNAVSCLEKSILGLFETHKIDFDFCLMAAIDD